MCVCVSVCVCVRACMRAYVRACVCVVRNTISCSSEYMYYSEVYMHNYAWT